MNRKLSGESSGILELNVAGWKWESVTDVKFTVGGNEMHFAIPRAFLRLEQDNGTCSLGYPTIWMITILDRNTQWRRSRMKNHLARAKE